MRSESELINMKEDIYSLIRFQSRTPAFEIARGHDQRNGRSTRQAGERSAGTFLEHRLNADAEPCDAVAVASAGRRRRRRRRRHFRRDTADGRCCRSSFRWRLVVWYGRRIAIDDFCHYCYIDDADGILN